MGAAIGKASDLGIEDDFKGRVQELVKPGTSAVLVVVRKATPDKLLEVSSPTGGRSFRARLHTRPKYELTKALHGDDTASGTWEHTQ